MVINGCNRRNMPVNGKALLDVSSASCPRRSASWGCPQQGKNDVGKSIGISRLDQQAGNVVLDDLGDAAGFRGHDRFAAGGRFQQDSGNGSWKTAG